MLLKDNMREIKFRVWDEVREKMYFWDGTGLGQAMPHWVNKKTQVMKCTGLKDRNGKEIFEGDLIENSKCIMECVFSGSCFVFKNDENKVEETCDMIGEIEVIGNIYENPKLLEEGK